MGNHEKMFLDFVQINYANDVNGYMNLMISGQQWVRNGGLTTIKSFLGEIPESIFETHKKLNKKFPALIHQLAGLPYYMVDNTHNCVYVHAGFESNTLLKDQSEDEMLWIREPFFDCFKPIKGDVLDGRLIVHGHTPVQYIKAYKGEGFYQGKHHICIDGGAARSEKILIVKMDDFSYTSQSIKSDVTTSI
ncbi:hypothetical protein D7X33_32105 [Butyricicoccus sp. 1XD8-22]|nr:hypothetical protein D7X33_32105 [Butyricicoccus sp. 1XD8-22]